MDRLFKDVKAHLQDLEHSQRMTLTELERLKRDMARDLDLLRKSVTMGHAATSALGGTFAGIEQIFTDHEQRISAPEKQGPAA